MDYPCFGCPSYSTGSCPGTCIKLQRYLDSYKPYNFVYLPVIPHTVTRDPEIVKKFGIPLKTDKQESNK